MLLEKVKIKQDYYEGFWLWKKLVAKKGQDALIVTNDTVYSDGIFTIILQPEENFVVIPKRFIY